MKKRYPLCTLLSLMGMAGLLFSSCSNDDTPTRADNTFVFDNTERKIESVLYTLDEQQEVYTFYFSPTRNIGNLDAMLLADDYISVITPSPVGEIDLLSTENRLTYKDMDISSATAGQVEAAALTLHLTSVAEVVMHLDVVMKSGQTLRASYNGSCKEVSAQVRADVMLTEKIFGYYMGPAEGDAGTNGYYVALTNTSWEGAGTQFNLTSTGYALLLSFYGTPGESWQDMPVGTFTEGKTQQDHTFDGRYSGVLYRDDSGEMHVLMLDGTVRIERDDTGVANIQATFLDEQGQKHEIAYRGELELTDSTNDIHLPQLDRDIFIDGAYASGIYEGDLFDNGSGMVEITIIDKKGENNEPNGSAMHITLFSTKFTDPARERRLTPGTYTAAKTFEQGTWMPTVELQIMGQYAAMGTYALYDNGTQQGEYAYAVSGDIVIREGDAKNNYTIEYELASATGHAIRGTFTGEVFLEDQSSDDKNDGSSTLESDYEMDLSYLTRANCYPSDQIYVPALGGDIPVSSIPDITPPGKPCGYQFFTIGTTAGTWEVTDEYPLGGGWDGKGKGKLVEGDVLGIELLVTEGMEDKITPGTYSVTPNRYPAQFRPGVCVRGYNGNGGTTWQHSTSAIGWGYPSGYYDPEYMVENGWLNVPTVNGFASIYGGTVTVSKAEGGDNWFTFVIDGIDVVKHKVTGTWTGPVYLGTTDTPIKQSSANMPSAALRSHSVFREYKSVKEQMRNSAVLRSYN